MADECAHCKQQVTRRQMAVSCDNCDRWQHLKCQNVITKEAYRAAAAMNQLIAFLCSICTSNQTMDLDLPNDVPMPVPMDVDENSLLEDDAGREPVPEYQGNVYRIIPAATQRGKPKLLSTDGFTYTLFRVSEAFTTWRCSVRRKGNVCPVQITQINNRFEENDKEHSHTARPGIEKAIQIQMEVKKKATAAIFEPAPAIVDDIMNEMVDLREPEAARPAPDNLVRMANRTRQNKRPKDPTDLTLDLDKDYLASNTTDNFLRADVTVGTRRHLIFATDEQLELLGKAKMVYMDGTFKVVKAPFYQLFSIHCFTKSGDCEKQIPVCFALMSGRKKKDYKKILTAIFQLIPSLNIRQCVVDFESGLWTALRSVLPNIHIHGCCFHWCQAVWKKTQELGLSAAYGTDSGHKFIRRLLALPFLPENHIRPMFDKMKEAAHSDYSALMDYMEATWMGSDVWPISSWSVFGRSVRTNNDTEGWHHRLNRRARKGNLPFYILVTLLYTEATTVKNQVKLLSEGKLKKRQRRATKKLQGKIFSLWEEYSSGKLSVSQLLKAIGKVYGPRE